MEDNILGFPGYHITREGKLYNKGHPVKTFFHKGYERTKLRNNKVSKNVKIHRLVAEAYIPNPNNLPVVMHLDDNPLNNRLENLKWGTQKDNVNDSIINGKHSMPPYGSGLNSPRSLLSNNPRKQRRIHRLFSLGYTYKEIGRKVRLSPKVVSRFIRLRNSLD